MESGPGSRISAGVNAAGGTPVFTVARRSFSLRRNRRSEVEMPSGSFASACTLNSSAYGRRKWGSIEETAPPEPPHQRSLLR